jgi:DNA-binding MarR family transcriptional regulator
VSDQSPTGEKSLVWDKATKRFVPYGDQRKIEKFLKGPVPWPWLEEASHLPGKALQVGLCLWRLAGSTNSMTIKLSNTEVAALGVKRDAKSRALKHLETAGLVKVERHRGKFPRVTIVSAT